jgi:hypothetical protein
MVLSQRVPEGSEESHGNLRITSDPQRFEPGVPCFECDHVKLICLNFHTVPFLGGTLKSDDSTHTVFRAQLSVLKTSVSFKSIGPRSDTTGLYGFIKHKENLKVFCLSPREL